MIETILDCATDEQIKRLLHKLSDYVHEQTLESGLPIYDRFQIDMTNIVKEWLKENKLGITIEINLR